jgi:hypothetical protein
MRFLVCIAALAAATAWAAGGKEETNKGDRAAAGGTGSTSSAGNSPIANTADVAEPSITSRDRLVDQKAPKRWEALVGYEVHRMWIQTDLGGDAPNKLFNYFYASFRFDITSHDRLRLRFGVYERFVADPNETGWRTDDLSLSYTRIQELPWKINLAASLGVTAPVSFYSQLSGMITAPSVSLDISRQFFGLATIAVRPFGVYYVQRYTSEVGGAPNPIGRVGVGADLFVDMPFLPSLTLGVDAYTGYSWYYAPGPNLPAGSPFGTTADATYTSQPMQQSYGGEIYVRYAVPELLGIKSDVTVALADGDPTLGYSSRLHDGQSYFYVFYRHTAEMYANLTVRY